MLFDSQGVVIPPASQPTPETGEPLDPAEAHALAMSRIANAMADLTARGAKAHRNAQDTVRVNVTDLFVVCQALYAIVKPQD